MDGDHKKFPRGNTRCTGFSVRGYMASPLLGSWPATPKYKVLERKRSRPRRHFTSAIRGLPASPSWPGTTLSPCTETCSARRLFFEFVRGRSASFSMAGDHLPKPRTSACGARRPTSSRRPRLPGPSSDRRQFDFTRASARGARRPASSSRLRPSGPP